jgi:hypothetical protein
MITPRGSGPKNGGQAKKQKDITKDGYSYLNSGGKLQVIRVETQKVEGDQTSLGYEEKTKKIISPQESFFTGTSQRTRTALFDLLLQKTADVFSDHETGDYNRCSDA